MARHHKLHRLILLASSLVAMLVPQASAQTDIANIQDQILRNEEMLVQARDLVRQTSSIRARALLDTAVKLHIQSKNYLSSQRPVLAAQAARRAREAILQSIALAKKDAKLEENAAKAIDRATNRLDRAQQLLSENRDLQSGSTRKMIEEATTQLQRARDNMREHHYEVAFRLARSSEELSQRAIATVRSDFTDPELVLRELQRTDELFERIEEQLYPESNNAARSLFEEAAGVQRNAQDNYHRGNFQLALEMTQTARRLAVRVTRMLGTGTNRDNVEEAIRLTDMLLGQARDIVSERDAHELARRIEQATNLQTKAKDEFQRGHYENALNLTLRSRSILRDALGTIKKAMDPEEVRATMVQTDEVLARLREALADSDNSAATDIFVRASSQQEKAWDELNQGRLRAALAHTKLARRLARRAFRELNGDEL